MLENDIHEQIRQAGKEVAVHCIIVGGATLPEPLNDLDALARQLPPEAGIIVWLNEHFGSIRGEAGQTFYDMEVYKARIAGLIFKAFFSHGSRMNSGR